jgi:hypothetical protein
MRNEIIQMYLAIIMMVFNIWSAYFHKKSFHYFKDYLMMNLTLVKGTKYLLASSNLVIKLENLDLELDNQNNHWEKIFCYGTKNKIQDGVIRSMSHGINNRYKILIYYNEIVIQSI